MQAIIFDMDGVLTDSEPVINEAARRVLARYGVDADPDDFKAFVGTGEDRYIGGVAEAYGLTYTPDLKRQAYEIYLALVPGRLAAFPGAKALIDDAECAGLSLGLASSADRVKIFANLEAIGIDPKRFGAVVSGEDVPATKPDPAIYRAAAAKLGVQARQCVVVEDSLSGVRAAKAAGMRCVAVTTSFPRERLVEAGADAVVPALADIALRDLHDSTGAM